MNLTSPRVVKEILAKHGLKPSRGLGQNFLVDRHAVRRLAAAAQIQPDDTILEIGPGIGTLTQKLALRAKKVIAVEKDQHMLSILRETLSEFDNIEVIHGDALKLNFQFSSLNFQSNPNDSISKHYKLIANLPYYITAPVIRKFLELESPKKPDFERKKVGLRTEEVGLQRKEARLQTMTLIIQKEVAQRICARPPKMSILAVSVQVYATPKIVSYVKKASFWPQPKVDGAILQITSHPQAYPLDFHRFFTIVKAGFAHPRKQLLNNLSTGLNLSRDQATQWLTKNNIDPARRAETLSIKEWISLSKTLCA